jgi:hypothetical protein
MQQNLTGSNLHRVEKPEPQFTELDVPSAAAYLLADDEKFPAVAVAFVLAVVESHLIGVDSHFAAVEIDLAGVVAVVVSIHSVVGNCLTDAGSHFAVAGKILVGVVAVADVVAVSIHFVVVAVILVLVAALDTAMVVFVLAALVVLAVARFFVGRSRTSELATSELLENVIDELELEKTHSLILHLHASIQRYSR